jgi:hypothetical protein
VQVWRKYYSLISSAALMVPGLSMWFQNMRMGSLATTVYFWAISQKGHGWISVTFGNIAP